MATLLVIVLAPIAFALGAPYTVCGARNWVRSGSSPAPFLAASTGFKR
jgi:hypothetical protein